MSKRAATPRSPAAVQRPEKSGQRTLQDYPRHERDNANKVSGAALIELGRRHGLPKSSMERMTESKLRQQISLAQTNAMQLESP
jgi:hypothetical protein